MLNRDDWSVLRDDSVLPTGSYILVYQLNKNHEFDQYVQRFASKVGLPVYRIAYGVHEKRKGEHTIVCPPVGGFVSLFMNAEYVITDSFHGTAFSMNLGRKFVAISPGRFSGRIMNLLGMTGETRHYLDDWRDLDIANQPIDHAHVAQVLETKRTETKAFLVKAINE